MIDGISSYDIYMDKRDELINSFPVKTLWEIICDCGLLSKEELRDIIKDSDLSLEKLQVY